MANSLHLEIVSPARVLSKFEAKAVTVPGAFGFMTILPGHAPMISEISVGELKAVDASGKVFEYFVSGGYLECGNSHVQILVEVVEQATEIDLERAKKARQRAAERLSEAKTNFARAEAALKRADARIKFAGRYQ